jgi:rhamnulokinase
VPALVTAADAAPRGGPCIDPDDGRFAKAVDMEHEIRAAAGLPTAARRDEVVRCILDSLASTIDGVVAELGGLLGRDVAVLEVVGGGVRNNLFVRLLEEAAGIEVRVGPAEATVLGNVLVQSRAIRPT